jgi:hypothetical protein
MRTQTIWLVGVAALAACGGSSPAFCMSSVPAERDAPGVPRQDDVGDFTERELDVPVQKPTAGRRTRDGDTAGAWWMSGKASASTPSAKR